MNNIENNLFQIGDVVKTLGITRRILINYEDLGLLTPTVKKGKQGFRFYSADDIVHIKLIRSLQQLGLSLSEIRSYFENTTYLDSQIERLISLRNQLDQFITQLRLRQSVYNEAEIHNVTLPSFTAYCREFHDADIAKKTTELRQALIDAIRFNKIDSKNRMCIQISINNFTDGTYIIPVTPDCIGKDIKTFPQVQAICIYYRGPYEGFPKIYDKLLQYVHENQMTPSGYFRNIYMEGPPTHGANKDAYMTQIALPIKFITIEDN